MIFKEFKCRFSLLLSTFIILLDFPKCWSCEIQDSKNMSFRILHLKHPSEYTKVGNQSHFHITKKGVITMECCATFPIKISFSGMMPNEINSHRNVTRKGYIVIVRFNNNPQATGNYTCESSEVVTDNIAVKSTIFIFADAETNSQPFLLDWRINQDYFALTTPISKEEILIPCVTFRPNNVPSLYCRKDSHSTANWTHLKSEKYDDSKGFLVNITKNNNCSLFSCSLTSNSFIHFKNPEMSYQVYPAGVKKENRVMTWFGTPITLECNGMHPMRIVTFKMDKRIDKIVCIKSEDKKILKNWFIIYGKRKHDPFYTTMPAEIEILGFENQNLKETLPIASIHFNKQEKIFYCTDSSGTQRNITVINCHNLVNCESARRFYPWETQLAKYPYEYRKGIYLEDDNLKKDLKMENCTHCQILRREQYEAIKLGVVFCYSESENGKTFDILQYFVDLQGQIVEDMKYKALEDVLQIRMPKYPNKTVIYWDEYIDYLELTCEASIFIFANALELKVQFKSNSTIIAYPYPHNMTALYDDKNKMVITLNETIRIWRENITDIEIQCRALKWNNRNWEQISKSIKVKKSQVPKIIYEDDDYLYDGNLQINMTFQHAELPRSISCKATGIPLPTIQWMKDNDKTVFEEKNETTGSYVKSAIVFKDVLTVRDVYWEYTCIVQNEVGKTNRTFGIIFTNDNTGMMTNKTPNQDTASYQWIYYLLGAISLVVLSLLGALFIMFKTLNTKQTEIERLSELEINQFMNGDEDLVRKYQELHDMAQYLPYKKQFEIHRSKIEIKNDVVLGTGNNGIVLKGILEKSGKKIPVALKTVKSGVDIRHLRALLSELKIMMYIGQHPHIIEIIGAITKNIRDGQLFVAVEFCSNGNLQNYLRFCRPIFHNQIIDGKIKIQETSKISKKLRTLLSIENAITSAIEKRRSLSPRASRIPEPALLKTTTLINWCYQIASGMEYLATINVIHGDLATRNILITDDLSIKITDFGLSRYLYDYSNYVTKDKSDPVPWRWLSIEAIQDSKFSTQSDIWAYGVTLWEIFSLGETPYQGFCWGEEFVHELCNGYRMGKPQYATTDIHNKMMECWNTSPKDRPKFEDISKYFKELLESLG